MLSKSPSIGQICSMIDILLDTKNDLTIENGDFLVGFSNLQHQRQILTYRKGEVKEFPEVGVSVRDIYDDENPKKVLVEIKKQFEYDGMQVDDVTLKANGELIPYAKYKN